MNGYMLDTDTASVMIRDLRGGWTARAIRAEAFGIAVSLITAGELRFGAARQQGARWYQRVERFLGRTLIIPVESPTDRIYADVRATLERQGRLIGANDLWLAAHALALDRTLVTGNEREFSRVPGLRVENWLA